MFNEKPTVSLSGFLSMLVILLHAYPNDPKFLHCLLFHLHHFDKTPSGLTSLFEF